MQPGVPPTLVFITVIFGASVFAPSLPPPDAPQGNLPRYRCSKAAKPHCSLCSFPSSCGAIPPNPSWGAKAAPHPTADALRPPAAAGEREARGAAAALPGVPAAPAGGLAAAAGGRWAGPSPRRGDGGWSRHSGPPQPELPNSHRRSGGCGYHRLDDKCWRSRCRDTEGMPRKLAPCSCSAVCTSTQGHQLCRGSWGVHPFPPQLPAPLLAGGTEQPGAARGQPT